MHYVVYLARMECSVLRRTGDKYGEAKFLMIKSLYEWTLMIPPASVEGLLDFLDTMGFQ